MMIFFLEVHENKEETGTSFRHNASSGGGKSFHLYLAKFRVLLCHCMFEKQ